MVVCPDHGLFAWRPGAGRAKAIHLTGADVHMTVRDIMKGKQIAAEILADGKPGRVETADMYLGSLERVRAAAMEFLRKSGNKLNAPIVISNCKEMGLVDEHHHCWTTGDCSV